MIALDASAVLALLFVEAGHERVAELLPQSCMSTVNLAEVVSRFTRDGHDASEVMRRLTESQIEFVPFLAEDAALAAALVPIASSVGLSLGDRVCLALGMARRIPICTADRVWPTIGLDVEIEPIR